MHIRPNIRALIEADLSVIRAWMRDASQAPAWSDADLAGLVAIPTTTQRKLRKGWVAENGQSDITGFAVASALCIPHAAAECELEFVLVPPQARRQGIGRMLVETVLAWARDLGAQEIWLEARESNATALRLYAQCGFLVAGRRPAYYANPAEDAVLMRCRISYVPPTHPYDAPV
jgi:ribosomal protein S18 acetylase RimI-like enzyme